MFNLFRNKTDTFYTTIHSIENCIYAVCEASQLINSINVDIALLNRAADDSHIKRLLDEFRNTQHFMGSIKLVYQTEPIVKYRIIDGQHRYLALCEYLKEYENDVELL